MVPRVIVTTFLRVLNSGRTRPFLALCKDGDGNEHEVVIKLRASMDTREKGLLCELLAALLARDLGVPVADPFLVQIGDDFWRGIPDQGLAEKVRQSSGVNYASKFLGAGYVTWPQNRTVSTAQLPLAADIFAFDVLVQNPDRRKSNPNLLRKDDEIVVFDHELAFSFLFSIVPNAFPWEGRGFDAFRGHVFWNALKGREFCLDRFAGAFEAIGDSRMDVYLDAIPNEWRNVSDAARQIRTYLENARENCQRMIQWIKEVLK